MATNGLIEENLNTKIKCPPISNSPSLGSMTHEEKQDDNEKSLGSKSSISDTSSAEGSSSICSSSKSTALGSSGGGTLQKSKKLNNGHLPIVPSIGDCVFEQAFEQSMADLEHGNDGYESDSEPSLNDEPDDLEELKELHAVNSDNLICSTGLGTGTLHTFPRSTSFEYCSSSSDSEEENGHDGGVVIHAAVNNASPKFYNTDLFHMRPYLMPFMERRRLSQCKEEEDEDEADKSPQPQLAEQPPKFETKAIPTPPPPPPAKDQASADKFKDLERLRQQFMHKIDSINTNNVDDIKTVTVAPEMSSPPPPPPIPPTILPPALINLLESAKSQNTTTNAAVSKPLKQDKSNANQTPLKPLDVNEPESLIIKGKFTVTKAQETPELRREAENLKNFDSSNNAHTISFPSSFGGYTSVQGVFSQRYGSGGGSTNSCNKSSPCTPHLSKKFFDSSLVEIRTPAESSLSLNRLSLNESTLSTSPHQFRNNNSNNDCDNISVNSAHNQPALYTSPAAHSYTSNSMAVNKLVRDYPHLDDVWIKRGPTQTVPKKQYYTTDESAGESGRTTAVQSEDVS